MLAAWLSRAGTTGAISKCRHELCSTLTGCEEQQCQQYLKVLSPQHGAEVEVHTAVQVSRRSAMELDRPSMQEVRPVRAPCSAAPCAEPLAKSASLPELAEPALLAQLPAQTSQAVQPHQASDAEPLAKSASLPELGTPAEMTQLPAPITQALQPDESEPRMRHSISADNLQSQCSAPQTEGKQSSIIEEPMEVLDLYRDKSISQEVPKKPEPKPEQANKWLAFQKLVSQQAAEEAAAQKVSAPHRS